MYGTIVYIAIILLHHKYHCSGGGTELSYEERAAQRRADRDRRRREREALAQ